MQQERQTLSALEVRVLVVTFQSRQAATFYLEDTGLPWPVLIDETRTLYHAYGLSRAKLRHLIGPTTLLAYAREALRGVLPTWPQGDTVQQGGDVLIDPAGIVRWLHVGAGSGYRPPVGDILDARRRHPSCEPPRDASI